MRIGFDTSPLRGHLTGVGTYVHQLTTALSRNYADSSLLGLSSGLRKPSEELTRHFAATRHVPVPTRALYRTWQVFGRPRADRLLGGPEIFHATNYVLPPTRRAATVLSIHDLSFLRMPEVCSPKIAGFFGRHMRDHADRADAVVTCSEATQKDCVELLGLAPEKVTVTYYAVEDGFGLSDEGSSRVRLQDEYRLDGPYFLYVGTLEPRKNVTALLEAFEELLDELPHTLVLVGPAGWNSGALLDALSGARLRARVLQLGYVPSRETLADFYTCADAFVFPSLYEGFGFPVLEAMTCGCPVICSDAGSLPEVGGDAALYVPPGDVRGLASSMRRVASDVELQSQLRRNGLEQAKRFSWATCARATYAVYQQIVGRGWRRKAV